MAAGFQLERPCCYADATHQQGGHMLLAKTRRSTNASKTAVRADRKLAAKPSTRWHHKLKERVPMKTVIST